MATNPPIESENSEQPPEAGELAAAALPTGALSAFGQELVDAAIGFATAARPANTRRAYERQWEAFERWCEGQGACALPAAAPTLALYLTARAQEGLTVATLAQAISAIADKHARAGLDAPHTAVMVQQTWEGIRRARGTSQRRVAPAVVEDLRRMIATLPSTLLGMRDRALLVIGFAGAFRRSELVSLNVEDVSVQESGLIVQVRRSKTDQVAAGTSLGLRRGSDASTCPVRTLSAWLEAARLTEGALFVAVNRHGRIGERLAPAAVAKIVKRSAEAAGLDATRYAGHSLRAGLATSAAAAGKSDRAIMRQGRWSSREMVDRYVREATLLLDLRWLDARLRAAGASELLQDWNHIEPTAPLAELARALRQSTHVLMRSERDWSGVDMLASQLLGRLDPHAPEEIQTLRQAALESVRARHQAAWFAPSLTQSRALAATLEGHSRMVSSLAVLRDGQLASSAQNDSIKLWNPQTHRSDASIESHSYFGCILAVLPDGRLASGSWDGTIKLWNPQTQQCDATIEGHANLVSALAVLSDGRLVSAATNTIKLWNPRTRRCDATLEGHTDSVNALAVLPDGRLASGSEDGTIKLWDPLTQRCGATLEGHTDSVDALAVLPDGRLASGSEDGTIKLWVPLTQRCDATLEGHTDLVYVLAVLLDGRLASGSRDQTIKLWNPQTQRCHATCERHSDRVSALSVLPDGRLASGSEDGTIKLWDSLTQRCEATLEGHKSGVSTLAVLLDGRLASGSWDKTIKLWNPQTQQCEATLDASFVSALAVLPDGRLALAAGGTITVWNPVTQRCDATLAEHACLVSALAVLPGGRLASASEDGTIRLWNLLTQQCEATLDAGFVSALAVLPDGRLVSADSDTIKLWNPLSQHCDATLEGHSHFVSGNRCTSPIVT